MTVWVSAWQMQCCGKPFRIGSRVSWTLAQPDGTPLTTGTVTAISAVHCQYVPSEGTDKRTLYPVPSSAALTPVTSAEGWTPDRDSLRFVGYLVHVAA